VLFVLERSWPLVVSLGTHVAIAIALVTSGAASKSIEAPHVPARDIWIGDTLEASEIVNEPRQSEQSVEATHSNEKVEPLPPPRPEPIDPAVHVPEAPAKTAPTNVPAQDSLAQRILAYRPRRESDEESRRASGPAPGDRARGTPGGMRQEAEAAARGFAKAFARALPVANSGDPIWGELPLGRVGFVRVSVTVDADGAIDRSQVWDKPEKPPSHLTRLVDRTLILLRGGHFALTNGGAGTETLRLDVTLSERPRETGPLALGFEAPSPGTPGRAFFQLASGRFLEAKVTIERR
jgi:hypothetical protein